MAGTTRQVLLFLLHILVIPFPFEELPCCSASAAGKQIVHDDMGPVQVSNPITTVPSTNPTPTIITVPSTNPTITIPSLNPLPTPIAAPSSSTPAVPVIYPLPTPSTSSSPTVPVTNPVVTTPSTLPPSAPLTNPAAMAPPAPITAPAVSGQQVWCVVKAAGSTEAALQNALDYACGIGGADCSAIQPSGSCYYPNTLQAHVSYAFNTYYQRNPSPSSCDFGGTAMLVNANLSSGSCVFASSLSSSAVGYNPASTTPTPTTSSSSPVTASASGGSDSGAPPLVSGSGSGGSSESSDFGSDIPFPGVANTGNGSWRPMRPSLWSCFWEALVWMLALCAHIEGMI